MSIISGNALGSVSYQILNSLRFRASASAYLSRTFGTPTIAGTCTFSTWIKRGDLTTYQYLFGGGSSGSTEDFIRFNSDNTILIAFAGGANGTLTSTPIWRDPSGWYHLVLVVEISQGTAANRAKLWVNSKSVSFSGTQNGSALTGWNKSGEIHNIGRHTNGTAYQVDGYLSDVYFIDGQALTPSSFGETNSDGVWVPKKYTGTYGNNGFYLPFNDGTSATTLCYDRSGNSNNWTPSGISTTAGVTYDWMVDTPTNNYAVLNPLDNDASFPFTNDNGNLKASSATNNVRCGRASIGVASGKWYWEVLIDSAISGTYYPSPGILPMAAAVPSQVGSSGAISVTGIVYMADGEKYSNGTLSGYGASFTQNDVIGFALDMDAGTLVCYKNNTSQGTIASGLSGSYSPSWNIYSTALSFNFGQRPFTYTPPTGFKALCTANLPAVAIPNPKKHFDAKTRSGTGAVFNVTGIGFQPDLVWSKSRSGATDHTLYDSVRGATKYLISNSTAAEATDAQSLTAFNSDGFSGGTMAALNTNAATEIDWLWKAGGAAVSNTAGSITSQVSANVTAGFSIVTYTGTGANATVGHGLGVAPKFFMVKVRNQSANWCGWHSGLTSAGYGIYLNLTNAQGADSSLWNSTAPSSTVLNLGISGAVNAVGNTFVAYCFAEVPGFSKFGSYTGNGSTNGPFVYCGFKPRWVMVKQSTPNATSWWIHDTARNTYNVIGDSLQADSANAESAGSLAFDFTANGFKCRNNWAGNNTSGSTYIFAAFGENPFGGSNVAPSPAR